MGLGLYADGSGISATKYLLAQGANIVVTDLKTAEQLKSQLERLGDLVNQVELVLGQHRESDFLDADYIIRNPGVPKSSRFLQIAREHNIPIESDISLSFKLINKDRLLAVTGTRGKSTTTSLLYEIIKANDKRAVLGGNITKSPLAQMSAVKKGGPVVLELSSFLLETLEPFKVSPHVAVFTNIYPDHLNAYNNIAEYVAAKENIWRWQEKDDFVILNRDNSITKAMGKRVVSQRLWFSLKSFTQENGVFVKKGKIVARLNGEEKNILAVKQLKMIGEHNVANACAATAAALVYAVPLAVIKVVLKNFKGIADRLELLKEVRGVKYYNDTTSTTPEAGLVALDAFKKYKKKIVMIAGGSDKGLNFSEIVKKMKSHCEALVLLNGTGTVRLLETIKQSKLRCPVLVVDSMLEAVNQASGLVKKGGIVLLSPCCASFGMFSNEFDRGEKYRSAVKKIK